MNETKEEEEKNGGKKGLRPDVQQVIKLLSTKYGNANIFRTE